MSADDPGKHDAEKDKNIENPDGLEENSDEDDWYSIDSQDEQAEVR
jgi:hypothetical protein